MIQFEQDWDMFPNAIADYNTSNETFLDFAELLDRMGISNSLWPLQLFQPELSGVDVYSDDLDHTTKAMIALEAEYNPYYYLREIARIPPISGIDPVPFIANRANMSLTWTYMNHIEYMLIQIRQTGKSVSMDCISTWLQLFAMRNSRQLLITKDDSLRRENIIRLRNMRGFLPKWLVVEDRTDAANQSLVTYNTRGNIYRTAVGQNSEDAALNVGRGASVANLHDDEGPFTSFIWVTLPAAAASGNAARDEAAKNGLPYNTVYTTTAGKIDSKAGAFMYKLYTGGAPWTEKFYDCADLAELKMTVKSNGKGKKTMITGDFDHLQLGYTDEWLLNKLIETGAEGEDADRDFFSIWTSGGVGSPLDTETLGKIAKSEKEPIYKQISPMRFVTDWYITEEEYRKGCGEFVIIGVDTSDAIGNDDIALTFTGAYSGKVLGAASLNTTNLIAAAQYAAWSLIQIPNSVLIIEKKSSAQMFIDTIIIELVKVGQDPFKRMYNRIVDNSGEKAKDFEEIQRTPIARRDVDWYDPYRKYFGFNTSGTSRALLYGSVLTSAAKRMADHIHSKVLSGQIRGLVVRNGRIDHAAGGHDDNVISWLLTSWLTMYGKKLNFYGIDTSKIKIRVGSNGKEGTEKELWQLERQDQIKAEIEEQLEILKYNKSPITSVRAETRLSKLNSMLKDMGGEQLSIDELIREARETRSRSKLEQRRGLHRR